MEGLRHRPTATAVVETSCNSSLAAWLGWSVACCGVMADSLRRMAPAGGRPGEAVSGGEVSGVESWWAGGWVEVGGWDGGFATRAPKEVPLRGRRSYKGCGIGIFLHDSGCCADFHGTDFLRHFHPHRRGTRDAAGHHRPGFAGSSQPNEMHKE